MNKNLKDLAVSIGIAISFFICGYYYAKDEVIQRALKDKKTCYDLYDIHLLTK